MNTYLTNTNVSGPLISIARQDFDDYTNNHNIFTNRINAFNQAFGLTGNNVLLANTLPTYYAGNFSCAHPGRSLKTESDFKEVFGNNVKKNLNIPDDKRLDAENKLIPANDTTPRKKFVIIGLNPGYNQANIDFENKFRIKNWQAYTTFHDNFFKIYGLARSKKSIVYYAYLAGTLAPNRLRNSKNWNYWDYCDQYIVNLDILPYHSSSFSRTRLSQNANNYIYDRFLNDIIPLLQRNKNCIDKVIIHNRKLFDLLRANNFIGSNARQNTYSNNRSVYWVTHGGIDYRIFSRFIPFGGFSRSVVQANIFRASRAPSSVHKSRPE